MNSYWLVLLAAVLVSAFSQMLLKQGARQTSKSVWGDYFNPWTLSGYGLMVLSTLGVVYAYRGVSYKDGPVAESLGFILVMILGRLFFGEKLNKSKVIGTLAILLGIFVFYL